MSRALPGPRLLTVPGARNAAGEFRSQRCSPVREFYLAVEDIYHSRTKTKCPHTNGICERFHNAVRPDFLGHDLFQ